MEVECKVLLEKKNISKEQTKSKRPKREMSICLRSKGQFLRAHRFGREPRQGSDQETRARGLRDKGKDGDMPRRKALLSAREGSTATPIPNNVFNFQSGSRNVCFR